MYLPRHFTEDDRRTVLAMLRAAAFGHLVASGPDGLTSTPLPFLVDDAIASVRGHLARPNPFHQMAPCDALLVVPVSDAYISPSWYPSKAEHGKVVPTWNYEVVHLHGQLYARDDPDWLLAHVRELSEHHEADLPRPWSVDDAPAGFVDQMARGIVGVEMVVDRIEAKRKLGQNRSVADRDGSIAGLRSREGRAAAVADAMESVDDSR